MNSNFWLTRLCFQRALAFIYFIGFLILVNQGKALIGSRGLLPARLFINQIKFWQSPSVFFVNSSDSFLIFGAWFGLGLSVLALTGFSESFGLVFSMLVWFLLWAIYLSFVNIGQTFYGFGWEILLLETGFLSIFLGSKDVAPPVLVIWLLRWVLFRVMLGAGLIKIRGDSCWKDLTCMFYHYETQPSPNPLSIYFHRLPGFVHKSAVLFTHFVELIIPFGYFGPRYLRYFAVIITVCFQLMLIVSGNLSWLNYITIVLCVACLDDALLSKIIPITIPENLIAFKFHQYSVWALAGLVGILSWRPVVNMISPGQVMNSSFEPLQLVNTYGAFGSVTRNRMEVVIQGTDDQKITPTTNWKEYGFKAKPGDVHRMPPLVSPYHYKLDWQMWFAAMSDYSRHPWILNLVAKFLQDDREVLSLVNSNPFKNSPPKFVRARLYEYHFSQARDPAGSWWSRELRGEYLPPLSLENAQFKEILKIQGWD